MPYLINHGLADELYNGNTTSTLQLELAPLDRHVLMRSIKADSYPHHSHIDDILFPRVEKYTYSFVYIPL